MKILLHCFFFFLGIVTSRAQITASSYTTQTVTLPGDSYTLYFAIFWTCTDFPVSSSPGRVELINSQGNLVGWAEGHVAQSGATGQTNLGSVSVTGSSMSIMAPTLMVADGSFSGIWNITGVSPGTYTLRFWDFENQPGMVFVATVWTRTLFQGGYAPPPLQYTLTTSAGSGGSVSPGGVFNPGTTVAVTATPDALHDFAGWNGDAGGSTNPISVMIDRDKAVQALFSLKNFTLTTSASGGSVTSGGTYPYGTTLTLSATPDSTHRFVGWTGDASGSAPSVSITMNSAKSVQAVFVAKSAQAITFDAPATQNVGASFPLVATASSGLPITFTVVSGPATFSGGTLTITGPGIVTLEASQPGDGFYLAAPPVTRALSAAAPALLKYTAGARTLLQTGRTPESIPYVIQLTP